MPPNGKAKKLTLFIMKREGKIRMKERERRRERESSGFLKIFGWCIYAGTDH